MSNIQTTVYKQLDPVFHPRSIALVGMTTSNPLHWTRTFWDSLREFGFEGPLYPVNVKGGTLDGCKVYQSLAEIPGEVDYIISTIAAKSAPALIKEAARRGVRAIHFCTAGFNETGEKETSHLQAEIAGLARETGVRVIGPNCMGIYCPESKMSFNMDFARDSGTVGFITQSGSNANYIGREARWRGVRFSKIISYGNACDLDECDFLEYMAGDPQTRIIALYIEGVKDGRRFITSLKQAAREKPIVLLKAGKGSAGARAAASHTAALSGEDKIWDALCRQLNIIRARTAENLVDILVTLSMVRRPAGRNVILLGPGGGASVLITDEFESYGFRLPVIPESVKRDLLQFSSLAGNIFTNPIDYSQNIFDAGSLRKAVSILTSWEGADILVGYFRTSSAPGKMEKFNWGGLHDSFSDSKIPAVMIIEPSVLPETQKGVYDAMQRALNLKIPVYYTFSGAAEALDQVLRYNEFREATISG